MQRSHRAADNDALIAATSLADALGLELITVFVRVPARWSTTRHDRVLWDGLIDVAAELDRRRIGFIVIEGDPVTVMGAIAQRIAVLVTDVADLPTPRQWRSDLVARDEVPIVEVDGDVVVPGGVATDRHEYAARTIRPRLHAHLDHFRPIPADPAPRRACNPSTVSTLVDVLGVARILDPTTERASLGPHPDHVQHRGGQRAAHHRLTELVDGQLDPDEPRRPDPNSVTTRLSTALHYGHISPRRILAATESMSGPGIDALVEQLVVRRELAINHCRHTQNPYDYATLPGWAAASLDAHRHDRREAVYTRDQFLAAETHDRSWNAAMTTICETGLLHNHLRMYWGKQVLAWSAQPEEAFATLLWLNNSLFLDGRDAVSIASVAWCLGLHDRPFKDRPVTGTVRPMTSSGLRRKFDVDRWVSSVEERFSEHGQMRFPT